MAEPKMFDRTPIGRSPSSTSRLRDMFAAVVAHAMVMRGAQAAKYVATEAYEVADAMMKERERKKP